MLEYKLEDQAKQWKAFANGYWQNSSPVISGLYPACTHDGFVIQAKRSTDQHDGLWWSAPYPNLPEFSLDMLNDWLFRRGLYENKR